MSDQQELRAQEEESVSRKPPPKDGSWKHVRYIPPWTDPEWQDDGPTRMNSDWKIRDHVLDRLRPALLVQDQTQNPTAYARRFGIFPGRTDGRSRTSPTRSESRILFPGQNLGIKTGKELSDKFQSLADQQNVPLDDYMIDHVPDMQDVDEVEQQYMQAYEELVTDEYWQGVLFRDMTMDDMIADGVFTMSDEQSNLSGDLDPLLSRHRWEGTASLGRSKHEPRLVYNINGERAEYDVKNNDKLWEALQPCLQLATRLLQADEPFLKAMQDYTNRCYVVSALDPRDEDEKRRYPLIKFRQFAMENDLTLLEHAKAIRALKDDPSTPAYRSWAILDRLLKLHFASGHYDMGRSAEDDDSESPMFSSQLTMGETDIDDISQVDQPIRCSIAAELVWPLLTDSISGSEKLMASFVVATTVVHEIMHAWTNAHYKLLCNPRHFIPDDELRQELHRELSHEMWPNGYWSQDPFYEDDAVAEVGHAYESHVLGGGTWPMSFTVPTNASPMFVGEFTGIIGHSKWPYGGWAQTKQLTRPRIPPSGFNYYLRISEVHQLFQEEFWTNVISRFGMAAVRKPPEKPHKVWCPWSGEAYSAAEFLKLDIGNVSHREFLSDYISFLKHEGTFTIRDYIRSLVQETEQYRFLAERFRKDKHTWAPRDTKVLVLCTEVLIILVEYKASMVQAEYGGTRYQKRTRLQNVYAEWKTLLRSNNNRFPDQHSSRCHGNQGYFSDAVRLIHPAQYEDRLGPRLMQLVSLLHDEQGIQEALVCELFKLPASLHQAYISNMEAHKTAWEKRLQKWTETLDRILLSMNILGQHMLDFKNEWRSRLASFGASFRSLLDLLCCDPNNVYANWRDMLITIPMLRKSRRKPWEQTFFLAKKEMLRLTGTQLDELKYFDSKFHKLLNLGTSKLVFADEEVDEEDLADRWDDVLGIAVGRQHPSGQRKNVFKIPKVQDVSQQAQDSNSGEEAEKSPRITLPNVASHPTSLGAFQAPQFGRPSALANSVPERHTPGANSAFSMHASNANPFPPRNESRSGFGAAGSATANPASQGDEPFGGSNIPAVSLMGGLLPYPYAVRETITADLLNFAEASLPKTPMQPVASSNQVSQGPVAPPSSQEGRGRLGNLNQLWEAQDPFYVQSESDESDDADEIIGHAYMAMAFPIEDEKSTDYEDDATVIDTKSGGESNAFTVESPVGWSDQDTAVGSDEEELIGNFWNLGKKRKARWDYMERKKQKSA